MKKIISVLICLVMVAGLIAMPVAAAYTPEELDEVNLEVTQGFCRDITFELGDANSDRAFNAMDSLELRGALASAKGFDCNTSAADMNADGTLTAVDSYYLKLCLAGKHDISQFENGEQIYSLKIGGYDISEFQIVIEEDCLYEENEYMAAELFREYINVTTGIKPEIVRGSAEKHGIYIHDVDKTSELGIELGNEGYKYEVVNGDLHVYGTDRGNMYAAYEIIEDYLGVGFVNTNYSFMYKQRVVDIKEGTSVTFVPGYRFRQAKQGFNTNEGWRAHGMLPRGINASIDFDYNNANIPSSYYGEFVGSSYIDIHSMHQYYQMGTGTMPDESYGTLEERYYAKLSSGTPKDETVWEPCATSESQYQTIFQGFVEYCDFIFNGKNIPFHYEDGTHLVSFSLCDNWNWCTCRNCKPGKNDNNPAHYTDLYLAYKNRGAEDIQEYYPGVKVYSLMYEKVLPVSVKPSEHLVLVLAGTTCSNHPLGTDEECHGNNFFWNMTKEDYQNFIHGMSDLCEETGAEIWVWYYPEAYAWWLCDIPCIYSIYYDVTWLYENGITGFYYEGDNLNPCYTFENLKAYMYTQVAFDPGMTFEEYDELLKDYLYMVYGYGWENIYQFIQMYEEAGDVVGLENGGTETYCFCGAADRAFDAVSIVYIQENYEEMRNLILAAIDEFGAEYTPDGEHRISKLETLLCVFDLLGLGATYVDSYVNGDSESRAVYAERYENAYNYYIEGGMRYYMWKNYGMGMPETCNLDSNPYLQFVGAGSLRSEITAMLKG